MSSDLGHRHSRRSNVAQAAFGQIPALGIGAIALSARICNRRPVDMPPAMNREILVLAQLPAFSMNGNNRITNRRRMWRIQRRSLRVLQVEKISERISLLRPKLLKVREGVQGTGKNYWYGVPFPNIEYAVEPPLHRQLMVAHRRAAQGACSNIQGSVINVQGLVGHALTINKPAVGVNRSPRLACKKRLSSAAGRQN